MNKYKQNIKLLEGYYIRNQKPKLDSSEYIKNLENEIGNDLPANYLDFLLNYGGFAFTDVIYPLLESNEVDDEQVLSVCFGILPGDSYDLIRNYHTFKDRIPPNFLPIACDRMGNLVCLSINGEDREYIYFWQHDAEEIVDDSEKIGYPEDVYLVAQSFDEFISSLEKLEDDDE